MFANTLETELSTDTGQSIFKCLVIIIYCDMYYFSHFQFAAEYNATYDWFIIMSSGRVLISAISPCNLDDMQHLILGLSHLAPLGQNGRHFADDVFKCIFMNDKFCTSIRISLKFVPRGTIDNKIALVQVMDWRRTGVRQDITWTTTDPVYWRICAALVGEEWRPWPRIIISRCSLDP